MKMKKAIAFLGAAVMALSMASCNGSDSANGGTTTAAGSSAGASGGVDISGVNLTEATAKNFKVKVADGWKLMSASEIGSMMENADFLVKGDKWDATAPYIQVGTTTGNITDWAEQTKKDIYVKYDGEYTINGIKWYVADKIAGAEIGGKIVTVSPQNGVDLKDKTVQAMMGNISWATGDAGGNAGGGAGAETAAATKVELEGYSVAVPSGWVSIPSSDKKTVQLYKTNDVNMISGCNQITITYKAKGKYMLLTGMFDSYDEVKDLKLGNYTWNGAKGPYGGGKDLMSLNTTVGEGYISADIWTKVNENTISTDDADVKAIMDGITVNAAASTEAATTAAESTTTTMTTTTATTTATSTTVTSTTTTTAAVLTTTTTSTFIEGGLPVHEMPTPGVHNFSLPADCPYDFDVISFHARNYYENHGGDKVQYVEAEKLIGDTLVIHLYDIVEFHAIDYQYYYVDYHNLKGTDADGNQVDLESTEQTVWFPGAALNSVDFDNCWGAALYIGDLNADDSWGPFIIKNRLELPNNAKYAEKYTFIKDIPESNYVTPVGGAKGYSQLWMIVPRPTVQKTSIKVLNKDKNGNPVGLVYNSANGAPIILACNSEGWCDCEVTFFSEADGVQRTFVPYLTKDTGVPACSESFIKVLN